MTENPYPKYIDTEGTRRGVPYRVWNEGYNRAIEDAIEVLVKMDSQDGAALIQLVKKVSK